MLVFKLEISPEGLTDTDSSSCVSAGLGGVQGYAMLMAGGRASEKNSRAMALCTKQNKLCAIREDGKLDPGSKSLADFGLED